MKRNRSVRSQSGQQQQQQQQQQQKKKRQKQDEEKEPGNTSGASRISEPIPRKNKNSSGEDDWDGGFTSDEDDEDGGRKKQNSNRSSNTKQQQDKSEEDHDNLNNSSGSALDTPGGSADPDPSGDCGKGGGILLNHRILKSFPHVRRMKRGKKYVDVDCEAYFIGTVVKYAVPTTSSGGSAGSSSCTPIEIIVARRIVESDAEEDDDDGKERNDNGELYHDEKGPLDAGLYRVLFDDGDSMDMEPSEVYAGAVLYHIEQEKAKQFKSKSQTQTLRTNSTLAKRGSKSRGAAKDKGKLASDGKVGDEPAIIIGCCPVVSPNHSHQPSEETGLFSLLKFCNPPMDSGTKAGQIKLATLDNELQAYWESYESYHVEQGIDRPDCLLNSGVVDRMSVGWGWKGEGGEGGDDGGGHGGEPDGDDSKMFNEQAGIKPLPVVPAATMGDGSKKPVTKPKGRRKPAVGIQSEDKKQQQQQQQPDDIVRDDCPNDVDVKPTKKVAHEPVVDDDDDDGVDGGGQYTEQILAQSLLPKELRDDNSAVVIVQGPRRRKKTAAYSDRTPNDPACAKSLAKEPANNADADYESEWGQVEQKQSSSSPIANAQSHVLSKVRVGSRISVLWPDDNKYYPARVTGRDPDSNRIYRILYDVGDCETLDLGLEDFHFIEAPKKEQSRDATNADNDHVNDKVPELITCPHCSKRFKNRSGLTSHLKNCKLAKQSGENKDAAAGEMQRWTCPHCSKGLKSQSGLTTHLKYCKKKASEDLGLGVQRHCKRKAPSGTVTDDSQQQQQQEEEGRVRLPHTTQRKKQKNGTDRNTSATRVKKPLQIERRRSTPKPIAFQQAAVLEDRKLMATKATMTRQRRKATPHSDGNPVDMACAVALTNRLSSNEDDDDDDEDMEEEGGCKESESNQKSELADMVIETETGVVKGGRKKALEKVRDVEQERKRQLQQQCVETTGSTEEERRRNNDRLAESPPSPPPQHQQQQKWLTVQYYSNSETEDAEKGKDGEERERPQIVKLSPPPQAIMDDEKNKAEDAAEPKSTDITDIQTESKPPPKVTSPSVNSTNGTAPPSPKINQLSETASVVDSNKVAAAEDTVQQPRAAQSLQIAEDDAGIAADTASDAKPEPLLEETMTGIEQADGCLEGVGSPHLLGRNGSDAGGTTETDISDDEEMKVEKTDSTQVQRPALADESKNSPEPRQITESSADGADVAGISDAKPREDCDKCSGKEGATGEGAKATFIQEEDEEPSTSKVEKERKSVLESALPQEEQNDDIRLEQGTGQPATGPDQCDPTLARNKNTTEPSATTESAPAALAAFTGLAEEEDGLFRLNDDNDDDDLDDDEDRMATPPPEPELTKQEECQQEPGKLEKSQSFFEADTPPVEHQFLQRSKEDGTAVPPTPPFPRKSSDPPTPLITPSLKASLEDLDAEIGAEMDVDERGSTKDPDSVYPSDNDGDSTPKRSGSSPASGNLVANERVSSPQLQVQREKGRRSAGDQGVDEVVANRAGKATEEEIGKHFEPPPRPIALAKRSLSDEMSVEEGGDDDNEGADQASHTPGVSRYRKKSPKIAAVKLTGRGNSPERKRSLGLDAGEEGETDDKGKSRSSPPRKRKRTQLQGEEKVVDHDNSTSNQQQQQEKQQQDNAGNDFIAEPDDFDDEDEGRDEQQQKLISRQEAPPPAAPEARKPHTRDGSQVSFSFDAHFEPPETAYAQQSPRKSTGLAKEFSLSPSTVKSPRKQLSPSIMSKEEGTVDSIHRDELIPAPATPTPLLGALVPPMTSVLPPETPGAYLSAISTPNPPPLGPSVQLNDDRRHQSHKQVNNDSAVADADEGGGLPPDDSPAASFVQIPTELMLLSHKVNEAAATEMFTKSPRRWKIGLANSSDDDSPRPKKKKRGRPRGSTKNKHKLLSRLRPPPSSVARSRIDQNSALDSTSFDEAVALSQDDADDQHKDTDIYSQLDNFMNALETKGRFERLALDSSGSGEGGDNESPLAQHKTPHRGQGRGSNTDFGGGNAVSGGGGGGGGGGNDGGAMPPDDEYDTHFHEDIGGGDDVDQDASNRSWAQSNADASTSRSSAAGFSSRFTLKPRGGFAYATGDKVYARYDKDGHWYPATIQGVSMSPRRRLTLFTVGFDDGEVVTGMPQSSLCSLENYRTQHACEETYALSQRDTNRRQQDSSSRGPSILFMSTTSDSIGGGGGGGASFAPYSTTNASNQPERRAVAHTRMGHIIGISESHSYTRRALFMAGAHKSDIRWINGDAVCGCDSIILTKASPGRNEDDCLAWFKCEAGPDNGGWALTTSLYHRNPIRVFRSSMQANNEYAPPLLDTFHSCRYDGLYYVSRMYDAKGDEVTQLPPRGDARCTFLCRRLPPRQEQNRIRETWANEEDHFAAKTAKEQEYYNSIGVHTLLQLIQTSHNQPVRTFQYRSPTARSPSSFNGRAASAAARSGSRTSRSHSRGGGKPFSEITIRSDREINFGLRTSIMTPRFSPMSQSQTPLSFGPATLTPMNALYGQTEQQSGRQRSGGEGGGQIQGHNYLSVRYHSDNDEDEGRRSGSSTTNNIHKI